MTELWTGQIIVDGISNPIEDLHLWGIHENRVSVVPSPHVLHLIGNVHLSSVPLYLAAGPSTELSTSNARTEEWLHSRLVPNDDFDLDQWSWKLGPTKQLDIGILLRGESSGSLGEVTELLLYAEIQGQEEFLPAVPGLNLPLRHGDASVESLTPPTLLLKVYALPLYSEIITEPHIARDGGTPGYSRPTSSSNKRKSLNELFEDAALRRRKFNGRGGERVSTAMVSPDQTAGHYGRDHVPRGDEVTENANRGTKNFSRASSLTIDGIATEACSVSQGSLIQGTRSSLHQIENVLSPYELGAVSHDGSQHAEHNKAALSKVVMAGMRLHGLQQKKKRPSHSEQASSLKQQRAATVTGTLDDGADEYKLIYHQTLKAAIFAFRGQLSFLPLSQETMRDVVDRLLELFCSNTTATDDGYGSLKAPRSVAQGTTEGFDLPSSGAPFESTSRAWSTPTLRRSH